MINEPILSLAEVQGRLPQVRQLTHQMVQVATGIPDLQESIKICQYQLARSPDNRDLRIALQRTVDDCDAAARKLTYVLRELGVLGAQVKDLRAGVLDFYGQRDNEVIELCWRLGEEQVAFWHRVGDGFAGRLPL